MYLVKYVINDLYVLYWKVSETYRICVFYVKQLVVLHYVLIIIAN